LLDDKDDYKQEEDMNTFFAMGKWLTLGFWVLPIGALLGLFGAPWDGYFIIAGGVILVAHVLELGLNFGKLKAVGRADTMDVVMVLLVGLFHWMPILRDAGRT